jgi:transcriptional regulator GlxA family with amidase domain
VRTAAAYRVLTSAGVAAGIDLCLHMIRGDHGAAVANEVARGTVVPPHRDGGQAQYIAAPVTDADREYASSLRQHLRATVGVSPSGYRATFTGRRRTSTEMASITRGQSH